MSKTIQTTVDANYNFGKIATERALWVFRPVALVAMVVWCLHPSTTFHQVVERNIMLGFLFGATYGIVLNRKILHYYLVIRRKEKRSLRNQVPDEYFFGKVIEVLDDATKR